MNELHKCLFSDVPTFENNEERRQLLCSKKVLLEGPSVVSKQKLSKETLDTLGELGEVIKSIRLRMYNEGYEIVNGVVRKRDL
jgi:hypothetical protein